MKDTRKTTRINLQVNSSLSPVFQADLERRMLAAIHLLKSYHESGELKRGSQAWNVARALGWSPP